ncbi:hypothetical protein J5839_04560 [Methanosarcinaceae archaeon]|jgi:hypothetical protein|nr:hypothetical protein [Methanosarcinaceae archaeon]MBQ3620987.1 hypothetical protein [Methanosarcinaceae archaeon]
MAPASRHFNTAEGQALFSGLPVPVFSREAFLKAEKIPENFILDRSASDAAVYDRLKELTGASKIFRLSAFVTFDGRTVFLASSGPDEMTDTDDFLFCARRSAGIIKALGHPVDIGILSGGRMGDIGRCSKTDETIYRGMELEKILQKEGYAAIHHSILIEDAVKVSDLLISPDSLSGEMIVHAVAGVGRGRELGNVLLFMKPEDRISAASGNETAGHGTPDSCAGKEKMMCVVAILTENADMNDISGFSQALQEAFTKDSL